MKLVESAPSLTEVCRAVEIGVQDVDDLATLELPVVLLPDFDSLSEAKSSDAVRRSPAAYQLRERRILVNSVAFFHLPTDVAEAALAHEIGHSVCHRHSLMQRVRSYRELGECIVADLLACRWGFFDGLRKERLGSYGEQYCKILELWPNEDEFARRMAEWYQWYLTGLVGNPGETDDPFRKNA